MTKIALHQVLHDELVRSGILTPAYPRPSETYPCNLVDTLIAQSTWKDDKWVFDDLASP